MLRFAQSARHFFQGDPERTNSLVNLIGDVINRFLE